MRPTCRRRREAMSPPGGRSNPSVDEAVAEQVGERYRGGFVAPPPAGEASQAGPGGANDLG
jgi:hypothetical protein